jgi:hypothetical protein
MESNLQTDQVPMPSTLDEVERVSLFYYDVHGLIRLTPRSSFWTYTGQGLPGRSPRSRRLSRGCKDPQKVGNWLAAYWTAVMKR